MKKGRMNMSDRIVDFTMNATLTMMMAAMSLAFVMLMIFGVVEFIRYLLGGC